MKNLMINKLMWLATAILALVSALAGVIDPGIYSKVMAQNLIPPAMAQDLLTIIVALILIYLIVKVEEKDTKLQLVIIGIIGSLGYLYAIFSIERIYNWWYFCYLGILGLALYSVPISIASLNSKEVWKIPPLMKWISILFSSFIAILFCILWIGSLIPALRTGQKIELYYSIYILDLAWIMPGFLVTAIMSLRNKSIGFLLTPAMYILGIFVIFPLGLGELAKPFYGMVMDTKSMIMSFVLSGSFILMSIVELFLLKRQSARVSK